jgi:hypothetical protein
VRCCGPPQALQHLVLGGGLRVVVDGLVHLRSPLPVLGDHEVGRLGGEDVGERGNELDPSRRAEKNCRRVEVGGDLLLASVRGDVRG